MEFETVIRKQKPMQAVQVGLNNVHEIAEWCGGKVVDSTVRLGGAQAKLPAVQLDRQSKGGKDYTVAVVSYWVVKFETEFRIYKHPQYEQLFEKPGVAGENVSKPKMLYPGDYVYWVGDDAVSIPPSVITQLPAELSGEGAPLPDAIDENRNAFARLVTDARMYSFGPIPQDNDKEKEMEPEQPLFKNGTFVHVAHTHGTHAGRKGVVKWTRGEIQPPIRVVLQGVEGEQHFSPNELVSWNPLDGSLGQSLVFEEGERVLVTTTDTEWYKSEGVVKSFDEGKGTVDVAFADDVVPSREFFATELKKIN